MISRALPALVFGLTYLAISGLHVPWLPESRALAACAGAAAMLLFGGIGLGPAWRAIDGATLTLLFGMMLLSGGLRLSGAFGAGTDFVCRHAAGRPVRLLWLVTLLSGILSALLVNDAICLMLTPLVLDVCERLRLSPKPYLLALATGSNVGSTATLIGNPQNMIIGVRSGWRYLPFLFRLGPPALAGLVATAALLTWLSHRDLVTLPAAPSAGLAAQPGWRRRRPIVLAVFALATAGFVGGGNLALVALAGGAAILVAAGRDAVDVVREVDWTLLAFFAGLFVVVAGFDQTGLPRAAFRLVSPYFGASAVRQIASFSAFSAAASNVFSNVPFVLVAAPWMNGFAHPMTMWLVLAASSTLAGNLTIVGSMANMIVIETAGERVHVGFRDYARVGVPITVVTIALAAAWLATIG